MKREKKVIMFEQAVAVKIEFPHPSREMEVASVTFKRN
jgi:hypothetical protein